MFNLINILKRLYNPIKYCNHQYVNVEIKVKVRYIGLGAIGNKGAASRYNVYQIAKCSNCKKVCSKSKLATNITASRLSNKFNIKVLN